MDVPLCTRKNRRNRKKGPADLTRFVPNSRRRPASGFNLPMAGPRVVSPETPHQAPVSPIVASLASISMGSMRPRGKPDRALADDARELRMRLTLRRRGRVKKKFRPTIAPRGKIVGPKIFSAGTAFDASPRTGKITCVSAAGAAHIDNNQKNRRQNRTFLLVREACWRKQRIMPRETAQTPSADPTR